MNATLIAPYMIMCHRIRLGLNRPSAQASISRGIGRYGWTAHMERCLATDISKARSFKTEPSWRMVYLSNLTSAWLRSLLIIRCPQDSVAQQPKRDFWSSSPTFKNLHQIMIVSHQVFPSRLAKSSTWSISRFEGSSYFLTDVELSLVHPGCTVVGVGIKKGRSLNSTNRLNNEHLARLA